MLGYDIDMITSSLNERPTLSMEPNDYIDSSSSASANQADQLAVNMRNLALVDDNGKSAITEGGLVCAADDYNYKHQFISFRSTYQHRLRNHFI